MYACLCGLQLYVGEILPIGLSSRSTASVRLHESPEPAVSTSEGLVSVQFYKDPFGFESNESVSGPRRCVFHLQDKSSHAVWL